MYCKDRHVFASIYLHNSVWLLNKYQNILRMGIGKEESKNFKGYVGKTLRKIKEIQYQFINTSSLENELVYISKYLSTISFKTFKK